MADVIPKCNRDTIRSRLKSRGLKMKKLTSNCFIVHRGGEILTRALTLQELERWSWNRLQERSTS